MKTRVCFKYSGLKTSKTAYTYLYTMYTKILIALDDCVLCELHLCSVSCITSTSPITIVYLSLDNASIRDLNPPCMLF